MSDDLSAARGCFLALILGTLAWAGLLALVAWGVRAWTG